MQPGSVITYLVQPLYCLRATQTGGKGFDTSLCHVLALAAWASCASVKFLGGLSPSHSAFWGRHPHMSPCFLQPWLFLSQTGPNCSLCYFTLSNARWFYTSRPLGGKELTGPICLSFFGNHWSMVPLLFYCQGILDSGWERVNFVVKLCLFFSLFEFSIHWHKCFYFISDTVHFCGKG